MPRFVVPIAPPDFFLTKLVDQLVVRQDDVGALADEEAAFGSDAAFVECLDLLQEHRRIDHGALADDALGLLVEDPRGDQVENQLLTTDYQRVARVRASRVSHHEIGVRGIQVDDLALSFVAPLGAYNHDCTHDLFPTRAQETCSSLGSPRSVRARPSFTRVSFAPLPDCQINRS